MIEGSYYAICTLYFEVGLGDAGLQHIYFDNCLTKGDEHDVNTPTATMEIKGGTREEGEGPTLAIQRVLGLKHCNKMELLKLNIWQEKAGPSIGNQVSLAKINSVSN